MISIIAVQPTLEQNCDTTAHQMDGLNRPPGELGLAGDTYSRIYSHIHGCNILDWVSQEIYSHPFEDPQAVL